MARDLYDVWWMDPEEGEQVMEESHHRHWQKIVDVMLETELGSSTLLDFGCNQGGFLRFLYRQRPFRHAVGVDLARASIAVANERRGALPIDYVATSTLAPYPAQFDLATSSAVIYLIEDLAHHAKEMRRALKPGGVYYATYTDYRDNPSLPVIRDTINRHGAVKMQEHALDDIVSAFQGQGFEVSLRLLSPAGYVSIALPDRFFRTVADRMMYEYRQAYVFRFVAR